MPGYPGTCRPRILRRWSAAAALLIAVVCVLLASSRPGTTLAQGATAERIVPSSQTVAVGDAVFTNVTVENVSHLGAFEAVIRYDSSLITFTTAANGPFIGSSGRTVFCPPPVITVISGSIRQLRFGCVTSGLTPPGPSGDGLLATITWMAVGAGDATLMLTPSLGDELGTAIPAIGFDGIVHVNTGPTATPTPTNTPCPGPCPTDTSTTTPTATATSTSTPTTLCVSGSTTVCLFPPVATVSRGTTFDVAVAVSEVAGLGAFQLTLGYDPGLVSAVGASPGPFLSSTGRAVQCLGPSIASGSVQFLCVTLADTPAPPSGSGVIALLSFTADNEGTTSMDFSSVQLTGLAGDVISTLAAGGSRTIAPCDGPCPTATFTPTATATATATPTSTATATSTACPGACPTPTLTSTPTATSTVAPTNTPGPPAPLTLHVSPPAQNILQGAGFTVDVTADGIADLGAYEVGIAYDESILVLTSAQDGPLLGSTGRSVSCPTYSPGVGSVRLACITLGGIPAGANGSGVLARFSFTAIATGTSSLFVASPVVVGRFGNILPVSSILHGSVTVQPCGGPCPTATATPTPGAATPTPSGGTTILGVGPPSITANVGDTIGVEARIANATNVGSYDLLIDYAFDTAGSFEPNVLEFSDAVVGPFLGSTGRPVTCLPPNVDLVSVRIGCVTTGLTPPGPNGAGLLTTLHFRILKQSLLPMTLRVDASSGGTSDPNGSPQPFSTGASTTVTISAPSGAIAPAALTRDRPDGDGGTSGGGHRPASHDVPRVGRSGPLAMIALTFAIASCLAWRRRGLSRKAFVLTAGVCTLALTLTPAARHDALATTPVQVSASPISVNAFDGGAPASIVVNVSDVSAPGIASFEMMATFNATLVSLTVEEGAFLSSTGNTTACTTQYPSAAQIRFACSATGAPSSGPGGGGVLAIFHVQPRASLDLRATNVNPIITALDLSGIVLHDANGIATSIADPTGAVIAVRRLQGDVNHDCSVSVADDELIASHYFSDLLIPGYAPALDVEPAVADGDIDLTDVQFVLGRGGSSCAAPFPPQPPPEVVPPTGLDSDGDGCSDLKEPLLSAPTNAGDPWDFFSVPVPALFAAPSPASVFRNNVVSAADAQAVFAYFKAGARTGALVYEQDLNLDGIKDGVEYDRRVVGPGRSGPPDGVVAATDAQLAFAQFKLGYAC